MAKDLTFLKLGGSLITIKDRRSTVNAPILRSACEQIALFVKKYPKHPLLLGHGSGSFGHFAAKEFKTLHGIDPSSPTFDKDRYWHGFIEVYRQAHALNTIVMEALLYAGVPAISCSPVSCVTSAQRVVQQWNLSPLLAALENGMIPVVFGDVVFDDILGGTILSTEDLFEHLAVKLQPSRILLAGIEEGVWADFPAKQRLIEKIDRSNYSHISASLRGSASVDVTGGMDTKVSQTLDLTSRVPGLQARIFSGLSDNSIFKALNSESIGTLIFD